MYKLTDEEIEKAPDFKPVVGYEGKYEVGKDGSVWSLDYNHTGQRKELRSTSYDKWGHQQVSLCKDGKIKACRVHQLVLDAYLPKPSDELEVIHVNSTASDNRLQNLKWGTHKENNNDPHRLALVTNHPDMSIPIVCIETGVVYPSMGEASRRTGIARQSISSCCNDKLKSAGGYHWARFVEANNSIYS